MSNSSATMGRFDPICVFFEKALNIAINDCKLGPGGNINIRKGPPRKKGLLILTSLINMTMCYLNNL